MSRKLTLATADPNVNYTIETLENGTGIAFYKEVRSETTSSVQNDENTVTITTQIVTQKQKAQTINEFTI